MDTLQPVTPPASGEPQPSVTAPVDTPTPTERLERMSETERTAWRQTGAIPGVEPPAGPAADGDDDASDALAPEPTPDAASTAGKTLAKRKQTAQERINELAREKYLLQGELNALRQQSSRPAAAVEQQPSATPAASPSDDGSVEPREEDVGTTYADYAEFVRATVRYEARLAQAADQQQRAQWQAAQHQQQIASAFAARVTAFKADTPDYDAVTSSPEVLAMAHPYMHRAIAESEHGPAVAYFLGTHLEECQRLASQPTAAAFDRAFGRLEARIEREATAAASPASTTNHITQAPAPPPTLGSRPVVPGDEVDAAIRRKDPGEYMRAMNAREFAARGR